MLNSNQVGNLTDIPITIIPSEGDPGYVQTGKTLADDINNMGGKATYKVAEGTNHDNVMSSVFEKKASWNDMNNMVISTGDKKEKQEDIGDEKIDKLDAEIRDFIKDIDKKDLNEIADFENRMKEKFGKDEKYIQYILNAQKLYIQNKDKPLPTDYNDTVSVDKDGTTLTFTVVHQDDYDIQYGTTTIAQGGCGVVSTFMALSGVLPADSGITVDFLAKIMPVSTSDGGRTYVKYSID